MRSLVLLTVIVLLAEFPAARAQAPSRPGDEAYGLPQGGATMQRLTGQGAMDKPLLPQPGNIWADVLPRDAVGSGSSDPGRPGATGPVTRVTADAAVPPASPSEPGPASHAARISAARGAAVAKATARAAAARTEPQVPAVGPDGAQLMVQLAAAASTTAAVAEWRRLATGLPALLRGHQPMVVAAEVDGHQIWRLRTGGFADLAAASAFCKGMRAAREKCWVVPAAAPD